MPYSRKKIPDRIKVLPDHAIDIWISAFNSALKQYNDEEKANQTAWSAVKKAGYKKSDDGWIKGVDSFHYVNSYKLSDNQELPGTIEIMRTGKWNHPVYGEFEITNNTIDNIITNFDNNVRGVDVSFDLEHGETSHKTEAVCWVKGLSRQDSKLLADIEWTEFGKDKIKDKSYRYFSPEFKFIYTDSETGTQYNNVLLGGSLTNRPFVKRMNPIMLSENINTDEFMSFIPCKLQTELQTKVTDNNVKEEEKLNKEILNVLKLTEKATEDEIKVAINKLVEDSTKLSELTATIETLNTDKTNLTKEIETLKADKDNLNVKLNEAVNGKSTADQQIIKLTESMKTVELKLKEADWNSIYSVALSEGKITPAMEEIFKKQYMVNPESTKEIIGTLQPIIKLGEEGSSNSNDETKDNVKLFDQEVRKVMKESNIDYENAMYQVQADKPELFKLMDAQRRGIN